MHTINPNRFARVMRRAIRFLPMGRDVVAAWFVLQDRATPFWVKAQVAAALAYLILPFDAIPDVLGPVGFADDAAALGAMLMSIQNFITRYHYERADAWIADLD